MNRSQGIFDKQGICVVLVIYNRKLDEVVSWPFIASWLAGNATSSLRHCLIYDNSPIQLVAENTVPKSASVIWNSDNGGTSKAYAAGTECAMRLGCDWLLLLDQDTDLPSEYLDGAEQAVGTMPDAIALVPHVHHGSQLVSPATITPWGSIRPSSTPEKQEGITTAISSGMLIRRLAIADMVFPPEVWLDYVDHWIFRELSKRSADIAVINVKLSHDLSVRTPTTLSADRLVSILVAETVFYRTLGRRAQISLPFRRLIRAIRYLTIGRPLLSIMVICEMAKQKKATKHD